VSSIDEVLKNAARYAEGFDEGGLPAPPKLHLAVVACMDARIDVFDLLGLDKGDAHAIRNAGGVVTSDVIRSLAVSQRLLGTREVMLVHHTGCGMATFTDDEFRTRVEAETGIRPEWAVEAFADVYADVRQSIARITASPFVPHRDHVRGFVYDVTKGTLDEVM
jgi:carbonic anhydrase